MIRKFYDAGLAEPPASTTPTVSDSIASIMARQGTKNDSEGFISKPIETQPDNKVEPEPAKPVEPVATTNPPATPAEAAKPEAPSQPQEPAKTPEPPIAAEPPKVPTLQEVLKSQQPDAVLKELGYDDNTVKLLNKLKQFDPKVMGLVDAYTEGKHVDYLRELTTDYSKMSAEEVMRHQLKLDYPTASSQQLDALFKREVVKAYSLDSEDEGEKSEGQLLLEAKADKHRATLIANQQNYLVPKAPEPKAPEPDLREQEQARDYEVFKSSITDSQLTKSLVSNKVLTVGEGDDKFNYPVADPNAIVNLLLDSEAWTEKFFTVTPGANGKKNYAADVETQLIVAAVLNDPKGFIREMGKHFKSLGGNSAIAPIDNAKPAETGTPSKSEAVPQSPAEAMAKQGRMNSGG